MYISVSHGSTKTELSDLRKYHAANGKAVNEHTGSNAKQEGLGGAPLYHFLNSKHVETKTVEVKGKDYTEAVVKKSTQERIDKCQNQNRSRLLLPKMGLSVLDRGGKGPNKDNKNATSSLKNRLSTKFGMAAHPDNRHGSKNYPNDPHPWYNMPMIFYFEGRKEDVTQYKQTLVAPNKEELAMLVKKREDAKNVRLAKKMMKE